MFTLLYKNQAYKHFPSSTDETGHAGKSDIFVEAVYLSASNARVTAGFEVTVIPSTDMGDIEG